MVSELGTWSAQRSHNPGPEEQENQSHFRDCWEEVPPASTELWEQGG